MAPSRHHSPYRGGPSDRKDRLIMTTTEIADTDYRDLDRWQSDRILAAIVDAQTRAVAGVIDMVPVLAVAGERAADRLRRGGRLFYAGAGSSGLLAQVDALELPGTYGIPEAQVSVLLAGGDDALRSIPSGAEDDAQAGEDAVNLANIGPGDVLVAVAASGRTPFTHAALLAARAAGALTIGIANNAGTPLLRHCDYPIFLDTPPEVVAGSTRMNAGTAQKCALNMLSTLIGIRLGHVYDGLMVNLRVENAKLHRRAVGIVARICGVTAAEATATLAATGADIKSAILLQSHVARTAEEARALITHQSGDLRAALGSTAARLA